MAGNRTTSRTAAQRRAASYRRSAYVSGTAARDMDIRRQLEAPKKELSHTTRHNRDKARHMNFAYVLFLSAALALTAFVLIQYIKLESSITSSVKQISRLESQINSLKLANDEDLSRIESSIDLEEIRRIAITELGMTYAGEGQIVEIPDEGSDYVRQYAEIHK